MRTRKSRFPLLLSQYVIMPVQNRLEAFYNMNAEQLFKDKRFRIIGGGCAALMALAWVLPDSQGIETLDALDETVLTIAPAPAYDLSRDDLYLVRHPVTSHAKTLTLEYGDSLGPLLQENGFEPGEAYAITESFSSIYDPRQLRVGQSFNLYYDDAEFAHLTYKPTLEKTVYVSRQDDGSYEARDIEAEFKMETVSLKATIENSIYMDAVALGAPDKVIIQFANIYEYSVDFQRDIQPGDEFEMFFEVARDNHGNIVKAGDLIFTSFSPRGKKMDYYLFTDSNDRENFYDAEGKTAKRKLRATPVNGARLSSSYGRRRHPIQGYRKMHSGVDFAAPTGTPIMAAGNGTVEVAGRNGGYGNYIRIRHTDGYKTAYAHLSKFGRGIKSGTYVTQDQIIGYVGSTGMSTGPHLHYEVHLHGKKINPRRLSQLSGKPLSSSEMPAFNQRRSEIDLLRDAAPVLEKERVAEIEMSDDVELTNGAPGQ